MLLKPHTQKKRFWVSCSVEPYDDSKREKESVISSNKLFLPSNSRITFGLSTTHPASFSALQHVLQILLFKHHCMILSSTFTDHLLHSRHYRMDIDESWRLHFVALSFKAMGWHLGVIDITNCDHCQHHLIIYAKYFIKGQRFQRFRGPLETMIVLCFFSFFPHFLSFLYHKVGPFRDKMLKYTCNNILILTSKTPLAANVKLHCNMVTS